MQRTERRWAIRVKVRNKDGTYDPPFLLGRYGFKDGWGPTGSHQPRVRTFSTRALARHAHKYLQSAFQDCSTVVKVHITYEVI